VAPICPSREIAKGPEAFTQEFGRNPVGTGPFRFAEWRAAEQISFDRFDDYWGGPAKLEHLIYRIVPDDNTQLVQLRTGEIQLCSSDGALTAIKVDEALAIEGVQILETITSGWKHFDLKHIDHLRVTKVRQALDYATPKQQIIEQLLKNRVIPSVADQTPVPGNWAFNPNVEPRPYDPDMAKQLLEEAGLTLQDGVWTGPTPTPSKDIDPNTDRGGPVKPLEIELWAPSGETQNELIQQVVAQAWNDIGIKSEAKYEDVSTIFGPQGYTFTDKMTAGLYAWYNTVDPDDQWYWSSSYIPADPTASGGNTPAYFFPFNFQDEIDALIDPAVEVFDEEKRKELYWQAQELLQEEVPVIFLYWELAFSAVSDKIGGFWPGTYSNLCWNAKDWYLVE
jgi:peptide/nickel transport system substrate-binding protein